MSREVVQGAVIMFNIAAAAVAVAAHTWVLWTASSTETASPFLYFSGTNSMMMTMCVCAWRKAENSTSMHLILRNKTENLLRSHHLPLLPGSRPWHGYCVYLFRRHHYIIIISTYAVSSYLRATLQYDDALNQTHNTQHTWTVSVFYASRTFSSKGIMEVFREPFAFFPI